jgi:hypothetical protein
VPSSRIFNRSDRSLAGRDDAASAIPLRFRPTGRCQGRLGLIQADAPKSSTFCAIRPTGRANQDQRRVRPLATHSTNRPENSTFRTEVNSLTKIKQMLATTDPPLMKGSPNLRPFTSVHLWRRRRTLAKGAKFWGRIPQGVVRTPNLRPFGRIAPSRDDVDPKSASVLLRRKGADFART